MQKKSFNVIKVKVVYTYTYLAKSDKLDKT